ncbi:MAG: hypothetical protein PVJ57_21975 [Phycisphaerae bacterium]
MNLRHLKETLGMRVVRSKSVAGVEREILTFALAYNAVCAVLTVLAMPLGTMLEWVSVIEVLRLPRRGLENLAVVAIVVNPDRPGRVRPRVVKRRPLQYPRMTRRHAVLKRELMRTANP